MSHGSSTDIEKREKHAEPDGFGPLTSTLTDGIVRAAREHGHNEQRDGRWVLDPQEAYEEFGEEVREGGAEDIDWLGF